MFGSLSEEERSDFDVLVSAVTSRFSKQNTTEMVRMRLQSYVKLSTQSYQQYASEIIGFVALAYTTADSATREVLACEAFLRGLSPSVRR